MSSATDPADHAPLDPAAGGAGLGDTASARQRLDAIRGTIDNIDAALIHLLAERFKATQRVGTLKAENDMPPSDPEREKAQIERLRSLAVAAHLDPEFAEKFLNFIISEVIRHHEAISEDHQRGTDA
ncbi:chorismate mutase [Kocuria rhizophila]|uniref:Chorismate mutase n=1 Tax=Kocuria rhizophila TaxID=72000 RepID=A0AAX2SJG1_KOCRH|nr:MULTISPECIES: chorismate mutase [Kocuria]WIW68885.1 chorismate mutase [Kocuria sp. ChxB]MBO4144933.1 chorismate mutase [Kocuria rhizophila]MCG7424746.1 chorismate mutase [Kocuria rhizophila]MCT1546438.1 chorismate mutase [Kocuria rhizophila]MCT1881209.1 chorismate mutase [Kocuria rhizophila]